MERVLHPRADWPSGRNHVFGVGDITRQPPQLPPLGGGRPSGKNIRSGDYRFSVSGIIPIHLHGCIHGERLTNRPEQDVKLLFF